MGIDFSIKNNYNSDVGVNLSNLEISVTPCSVEQVLFVEGLEGDTITIPKGTGTQTIRHYGSINTGTGDKFVLKNSHFSCLVEAVDTAGIAYLGRNTIITDVSQCGGSGEHSYIEYNVTALPDTDGKVTFSKCYVDGIPNF